MFRVGVKTMPTVVQLVHTPSVTLRILAILYGHLVDLGVVAYFDQKSEKGSEQFKVGRRQLMNQHIQCSNLFLHIQICDNT
jgi:hypothetical protein